VILSARSRLRCWIDDVGEYIEASLHHTQCRSPEWRDKGPLILVGGRLSWKARMVTVPVETGDLQAHPVPMLLLNPGLEQRSSLSGTRMAAGG
jgi:hypothetical protein